MKKILVLALALASAFAFAAPRPRGCGLRPGAWHRTPPRHHHYGHRGDRAAPLVGFAAGAAVGSIVASSPRPVVRTTVVQAVPVQLVPMQPTQMQLVPMQPTAVVAAPPAGYVNQQVWVPGRYTDVIQPNGVVVRAWTPGRWENRVVPVAR